MSLGYSYVTPIRHDQKVIKLLYSEFSGQFLHAYLVTSMRAEYLFCEDLKSHPLIRRKFRKFPDIMTIILFVLLVCNEFENCHIAFLKNICLIG